METKINKIREKLSRVRVGLPERVEFIYSVGQVICFPKERKWIIKIEGKSPITHRINNKNRIDVTKYKARLFLKLAIAGLLREDEP